MQNYQSRKNREAYWKNHMENYSRTNISQREYCARNGLSYWSFNSWKRRIENGLNKNRVTEIPREVTNGLITKNNSIEVVFSDSLKINISGDFEPELLKKIINTVGIEL